MPKIRYVPKVEDIELASMTEMDFQNRLEMVFRFGADEKFTYAGPEAMRIIETFAFGKHTLNELVGTSLPVKRYETPFGTSCWLSIQSDQFVSCLARGLSCSIWYQPKNPLRMLKERTHLRR